MGFYKLCCCGERNRFDNRWNAPRKCSKCQRSLFEVSTVEEGVENQEEDEEEIDISEKENPEEDNNYDNFIYCLIEVNSKFSINIPKPGGIVGRGAIGAEELKDFSAVSREHIRISYRGNIGVLIEDLSKFGTFINGEQLIKETPKFARDGDVIRLYNVELRLERKNSEV